LYELRILKQEERAAAATLIVEKGIDSEGSHEVAKALKDFSRLSKPPAEFLEYPGDAIAYHYWKLARQQSDLQARSRLIASGLRFASSDTARQEIERLLTDFTVTKAVPAPRLPLYRLETETEVPKVLPVVGKLPHLTVADLRAVPLLDEDGPFSIVQFSGSGAWVPVPRWQVILGAEDPVALLTNSEDLPLETEDSNEQALIVLDRAQRQWDDRSYFLVEQDQQLKIQWFEDKPSCPLFGKVLLVMRPRKVLDEEYNKELWQIDE
jgi:hypothetical protein